MNRWVYVCVGVLILSVIACGPASSAPSSPQAPISPISVGSDLTAIDLCQAIPQEDIAAVMGRKFTSQRFEYYDATGTSGCWYDGGKDNSGTAYFGYVVLTPVEVYASQPLYLNVDVKGLGQSAYFNNGADARQLWVKVSDNLAFVVAFGDLANEDGARAIATLLLAALK
jgi:hypothetical protein